MVKPIIYWLFPWLNKTGLPAQSFINPLLQKHLQRSSRESLIALKDEQKPIEQQTNRLIQDDAQALTTL